jgi:hypothetical protein
MKTNADIPAWDCNSCRYASPETVSFGGNDCIECRKDKPGTDGFPLMPLHSWCWDGRLSDNCTEKLQRLAANELVNHKLPNLGDVYIEG